MRITLTKVWLCVSASSILGLFFSHNSSLSGFLFLLFMFSLALSAASKLFSHMMKLEAGPIDEPPAQTYRGQDSNFDSTRKTRQESNHHETGQKSDEHTDQQNQAREWYHILGVGESATIAEIREAYRRIIMQYHPDRVNTLGPELKALAERRTREINAAYERACRLRA
jgi:DnaJ like chaperone protein